MRIALFALPLALLACASNGTGQVPVRGGGGSCNAAGLDRFSGMTASQEIAAEMIKFSGASAFRWLPKDSIVTMEYRADRLNVHLDEANRIIRANCG